MNKYIKQVIVTMSVVMAISLPMILPPLAAAQQSGGTQAPSNSGSGSCESAKGLSLIPPWYKYVATGSDCKIDMKAAGGLQPFLLGIAAAIIEAMLYIVGYVSLGFIIFGGFKFMISGDNANGSAAARKTIINAVIGLIISIMSVGIVNVIANAVK